MNVLKILFSYLLVVCQVYATIPTSHLKGMTERFKANKKFYSPIHGFVALNNNLIKNTYAFDKGPRGEVARKFFHALSYDDINATTANFILAAHLPSKVIGQIMLNLFSGEYPDEDRIEWVAHAMTQSQSVRMSIEKANMSAQGEIEQMAKDEKQFVIDSEKLSEIKKLETKELTPLTRKLRDLRKARKKAKKDEEKKAELTALIEEKEKEEKAVKESLQKMREGLITGKEMKEKREDHAHFLRLNTLPLDKLDQKAIELATLLVESVKADRQDKQLGKYTTRDILLAYMWNKYNEKVDIKQYFVALKDLIHAVPKGFYSDYYSSNEMKNLANQPYNFRYFFSQKKFFDGIHDFYPYKVANPGDVKAIPVVSFNLVFHVPYKSKAGNNYSFADCGENAMRNFFNVLLYNPETDKLDYKILETMRDRYKMDIHQDLIDFYKKDGFDDLNKLSMRDRYTEWVKVVSDLNKKKDNLSKEDKVNYRKGPGVCEITGPHKNLQKALSILTGTSDPKALVKMVNEITGRQIEVSDIVRHAKDTENIYIKEGPHKYDWYAGYVHQTFSAEKGESQGGDAFNKAAYASLGDYNARNRHRAIKYLSLGPVDLTRKLVDRGDAKEGAMIRKHAMKFLRFFDLDSPQNIKAVLLKSLRQADEQTKSYNVELIKKLKKLLTDHAKKTPEEIKQMKKEYFEIMEHLKKVAHNYQQFDYDFLWPTDECQ